MNTVLVATERDLEHTVLAQALDGQGYQIVRSRDGLDALEAARSQPPQVLLVNVALPKLDGFALFRRFQQDDQLRRIPIVLFSTRSNDQKSERFAQELGATNFVGNALRPGALNGVLAAALAAPRVTPLPQLKRTLPPPPAVPTPIVVTPTVAPIEPTLKIPALIEVSDNTPQLAEQVQLRHALYTAQQQLIDAQAWQGMFNLNPVAMWVLGKNSQKMLAVNEAALRLFAYSHTEFMQLDSPTLLRDTDAANTTNVFAFRSKEGRPLSLLINTRELSFKTQAAELWAAHDVSYRRGERAMADEVQRLKAILGNLPVPYWIINAEQQLCDVNPAACRLLGYSREQLLEQGWAQLLTAAEPRAELQQLAAGAQLALSLRRSDDSQVKVMLTAGHAEFGTGLRVLTLQVEPETPTVELPIVPVNAAKLPAVLEMLRYAEDADEATLLQYAMAQLAHAFNSPLALFASVERITQTLDVCATNDAQSKRRGTLGSINVPNAWRQLLTPRSVRVNEAAEVVLQAEGLPTMNNYMACSTLSGRELWLLVIANRDTHYTELEQRELQECADILVALVGRMRQQFKLQAMASRSAAASDSMLSLIEKLLDHHDAYAAASGQRVAALAVSIARQLNLRAAQVTAISLAARLHDIGHLLLPQSLLLNPAPLTVAERALLQTHVERGVSLLNGLDMGADIAGIVAQHHERLDGSGYPAALRGEQIMIEASVVAVADLVEAMCAPRAYRPGCGLPAALDELRSGANRLYDPQVVAACERVFAANEGRWP